MGRSRVSRKPAVATPLAAGGFSAWLCELQRALRTQSETHVACGSCNACCSSAYFIHVRPEDKAAHKAIQKSLLVQAPGLPKGHKLLGHDVHGMCPLWKKAGCSIYVARPLVCRIYDCRIFAAVGILAGGDDKARINAQVLRWKFSYPTPHDRAEHRAVQAALSFIRDHAVLFPGGRVPSDANQLALLAIMSYGVFLKKDDSLVTVRGPKTAAKLAARVVEACRVFAANSESTLTGGGAD